MYDIVENLNMWVLSSDKRKAGVSEQCSCQPYFNDKILFKNE
jgi:hypothetical protein